MKELKHLKTFEQYTNVDIQNAEIINEGISLKDIESVKGNKDGLAKYFNKAFIGSLRMGVIKQQYNKEIVSDLDNIYKCLVDGANDNFKGGVRINPEGKLQYARVKFGSDAIGSSAL